MRGADTNPILRNLVDKRKKETGRQLDELLAPKRFFGLTKRSLYILRQRRKGLD